ncbi:nickel-dependent lactate racemase [bacterium]|nr:nickel-dependent lactate racemase [bacterium]
MNRGKSVLLRFGREVIKVALPAGIEVIEPARASTTPPEKLLEQALAEPIASASLNELARRRGEQTAVVIVPDQTRRAHVSLILPRLLTELEQGGFSSSQLTVVIALGLHRELTEAELLNHLGAEVLESYRVIQSQADRGGDFLYAGTTRQGNRLLVNRVVMNAGLRITLSEIDAHYFAGFSGGRKAILPGSCARESIVANHRLVFGSDGKRNPAVELGRLDGNPLAEELAEAQRIVGVNFAINVVNDSNGSPQAVIAGAAEQSFNAAVERYRQTHSIGRRERASVVIASAGGHPWDIDLRQAHKALDNACRLLRPGGRLLFFAACPEGTVPLGAWFRLGSAAAIRRQLDKEYTVAGQTAWATARKLERFQVTMVTSLQSQELGSLPITICKEPKTALERLLPTLPTDEPTYYLSQARKLFIP